MHSESILPPDQCYYYNLRYDNSINEFIFA